MQPPMLLFLRPETNSFKDYSLAILCMYFWADTSGRQPYFLANDLFYQRHSNLLG